MRRSLVALLASLAGSVSGCGVEFLPDNNVDNAVTNTCKVNSDCGSNAICTDGACFARSGAIDEVLLEVVPEANSSAGGLSFLSVQSGIARGDRSRSVELPSQSSFITQVIADGSDLAASGCPYVSTGPQTIQARIEFARVGAIGGVQILGLSSTPLTVETKLSGVGWNATASLVPGTYDIYVQPLTTSNCQIAPRILRGVDVPQTDQSIPPATLALPTPAKLNGKVQRTSGSVGDTLEGWTVDIIEPDQGRVISTEARLGSTVAPLLMTNFVVTYQRLASAPTRTSTQGTAPGAGPLIRISPPASLAGEAPVVYWDLAAADLAGDGHCNLDMSGVPSTGTLVSVSGQIQGAPDTDPTTPSPVRANLQFSSIRLDGADGLTAAFTRYVTTDDAGNYSTKLFPGFYRVVILPSSSPDTALPPSTSDPSLTGAATVPWAIDEENWTITNAPHPLNAVLRPKRTVTGSVFAGASTRADAPGATLNAIPTIAASQVGALKGVLAQVPVLPQNASVAVGPDGRVRLPLDPGDFDLSVRTPDSSNFAWWVWPGAEVTLPDSAGNTFPIRPRIPFPVPLEGIITVPDTKGAPAPLRGAAVRAYARVPAGAGVTKVGDGRTDDTGRYRLRLPPSFFGP